MHDPVISPSFPVHLLPVLLVYGMCMQPGAPGLYPFVALPCLAGCADYLTCAYRCLAALELPDGKLEATLACFPNYVQVTMLLVLALLAPISSFSDLCPQPPFPPQTSPVRCKICW